MARILCKLSVPTISALLLRCTFYYTSFLGIVFFGIRRNAIEGGLVCYRRNWLQWYCVILELIWSSYLCSYFVPFVSTLKDPYERVLNYVRLSGCIICTIYILVIQLCYAQKVVGVVNKFLRLFRRIRQLSSQQSKGYGGQREFTLILWMILCIGYEIMCYWPYFKLNLSIFVHLALLGDVIVTSRVTMIIYISFVGYLSIGVLYTELHIYVQSELRPQLRSLGQPSGASQLKVVTRRLNECIAIYDEIQSLGSAIQKLLEFPLFLALMLNISVIVIFPYQIVMQLEYAFSQMWGVVAKSLIDVVLLTLAVDGAVSSSRMVQRWSLENYYVGQPKEWHFKLEMFLNRRNFCEFRVCLFGLFEVSNEFILCFLSGLITYLTYIVQSGMQMNKL